MSRGLNCTELWDINDQEAHPWIPHPISRLLYSRLHNCNELIGDNVQVFVQKG